MGRYRWLEVYGVAFVSLIGCMITAAVGVGGPGDPSETTVATEIARVSRIFAPLFGLALGIIPALPIYRRTVPGPRPLLTLVGFFLVLVGWVALVRGLPVLPGFLAGSVVGFGTGIALPRPSQEHMKERERLLKFR